MTKKCAQTEAKYSIPVTLLHLNVVKPGHRQIHLHSEKHEARGCLVNLEIMSVS